MTVMLETYVRKVLTLCWPLLSALFFISCVGEKEDIPFIDTLQLPREIFILNAGIGYSNGEEIVIGDSTVITVNYRDEKIRSVTLERRGIDSDDFGAFSRSYVLNIDTEYNNRELYKMNLSAFDGEQKVRISYEGGKPSIVQTSIQGISQEFIIEKRYFYDSEENLTSIEEWRNDFNADLSLDLWESTILTYQDGNVTGISRFDGRNGQLVQESVLTYDSTSNPLKGRLGLLLPPFNDYIPLEFFLSSHLVKNSDLNCADLGYEQAENELQIYRDDCYRKEQFIFRF